jgi:hypothetical protein
LLEQTEKADRALKIPKKCGWHLWPLHLWPFVQNVDGTFGLGPLFGPLAFFGFCTFLAFLQSNSFRNCLDTYGWEVRKLFMRQSLEAW